MVIPYALDVVNEALAGMGQTKTMTVVATGVDEQPDPVHRMLALLYNPSRKKVLMEHPWSFAMRDVRSISIWRTDFESYVYVPWDSIRIVRVRDESGEDVPFRISGTSIICQRPADNPMYITYVADVENPEEWDSAVRNVLVCRLRMDFARPLKASIAELQIQQNAYAEALALAKKYESSQSSGVRRNPYANGVLSGDDRRWRVPR